MKSRTVAAVVGFVCGIELIVAVVIGGAGLGAIFGWDGAIVGAAGLVISVGWLLSRRARSRPAATP